MSISLVDTHCHIHEAWRSVNGEGNNLAAQKWVKAEEPDADRIIARAQADGVQRMVCVGTTQADSELAVEFVQSRPDMWASIGLHPHEAKEYVGHSDKLKAFAALAGQPKVVAVEFVQSRPDTWASIGLHPHEAKEYVGHPTKLKAFAALAGQPKVVAVGECGLDYYYGLSPKADQEKILRFQIELALEHNLPMIFHVRDAFQDFWPVFDSYQGVRGVMHSFSAGKADLEQVLARGLYVGLNGIMTFTKQAGQLEAAKAVPLDRLLLETDAPFLTPAPFRGTICEPKHVRVTAEFLAQLRNESLDELATATTANAQKVFGLRSQTKHYE